MSTITFAPDAPHAAIESALREPAFASLARAGAPVLVARCETLSALAMNAPMRDLFGATFEAVAQRLFHGREPGAQRLSSLARTLLTDAAPRLERMRFYFGPTVETVTFLCRRVAGGDNETFLVLAAPGIRAGLLPASAPAASGAAAGTDVRAPAEIAVAPMARTRFVWRTDRDHRLLEVTPPFESRLRTPGDSLGRGFFDILQEAGAVAPGSLAGALAARTTFSGLTLEWPAADDGAPQPVEFGGMPQFDPQKLFDGFRGYAVLSPSGPAAISGSEHAPMPQAAPADVTAPVVSAPDEPVAPVQSLSQVLGQAFSEVLSNVVQLRPFAPAPSAEPAAGEPVSSEPSFPDAVPPATSTEENAAAPVLSLSEQSAFDEIARTLSAGLTTAGDGAEANLSTQPEAAQPADGASSANLRRLVDLVPIGILVSRGGVAIFANRTLLDLAGFPDADAMHDAGGLDRLFDGIDVGAPADSALAVNLRASNGETIPVDARLHAIVWDGLPATLVSLRRAIDRASAARVKTLEHTLRENDSEVRELHSILDTATDGVVILDGAGTILSLNRSAEALFGCEQADAAGRPLDALVADESRAAVADYLSGLKGGGVASLLNDGREILCRAPRGGVIPVYITIGRLGSDETPKFCAVLRDLTAWKNAEQGLRQARFEAEKSSAQKSEFLARISHEIRTPLNAIIGFAEVIMDERFGPVGNERYREYMRDIHRSGEHVMSLVNDLLDLSKIEAGKMDMTFTSVDANACIADCVALMQPQANRARVVIRLSLAPRLPKLIADERALKQIVLNILSNAVKYNEPGGQVIVSTARTDAGHAIVRVRDTGLGMSENDVKTALEPFGQIDTSRATTGTGLGLPLTKALVEANRATFTIKSRKGEGTLVEIAFPPSRVMAE